MSESKLSPVSWTELVKQLRKLGFDSRGLFLDIGILVLSIV